MLKPSYAELMDVLNKDSGEQVTSRYTVVIASAKRARQLIDGDTPMVDEKIEGKPLSTAVEEIFEGKVKVVPEGEGTVLDLKKKNREKEEKNLQSVEKNAKKSSAEKIDELEEDDDTLFSSEDDIDPEVESDFYSDELEDKMGEFTEE